MGARPRGRTIAEGGRAINYASAMLGCRGMAESAAGGSGKGDS